MFGISRYTIRVLEVGAYNTNRFCLLQSNFLKQVYHTDNEIIAIRGEFVMTIPMLYLEFIKPVE